MSRQSERQDFLITMAQEGVPSYVSRLVLRHAVTLHRIAEIQCNGTFPPDHNWDAAESDTCACSVCRQDRSLVRRIKALLSPFPGIKAQFQGDPRGAVVRIHVPSGRDESWGGVAVP